LHIQHCSCHQVGVGAEENQTQVVVEGLQMLGEGEEQDSVTVVVAVGQQPAGNTDNRRRSSGNRHMQHRDRSRNTGRIAHCSRRHS
jgi:hypothetical protein